MPTRVYVLALGPIGDGLMNLSVLREACERNKDLSIGVIAFRNVNLLHDLASDMPNLSIIRADTSIAKFQVLLSLVFASRAVVVVPPTFGKHSFNLKLFVSVLTLASRVQTIGFHDKGRIAPYSSILTYDFSCRYIDNIRSAYSQAHIRVLQKGSAPLKTFSVVKPEGFSLKSYIAVHPFAANPKRSLPPKRWQMLVEYWASKWPVVITGSPSDRPDLEILFSGISGVSILTDLSLRQIAWIVENSMVYIGVDTGITHLAGVMQKQSIIFGNRSNPTWLPAYNTHANILLGDSCTCAGNKDGGCVVYEDGLPYYKCLYTISDNAITKALDDALAKRVNC